MEYPLGLLIVFAIFWLAWAIRPADRGVWMLEGSFTVATSITLVLTHPHWPLSDQSYTLIALLLALHTVGGHYRYGHVPYVAWVERVAGRRTADRIRTKRNHYDRLVHFAFGVLVAPAAHEMLVRYAGVEGVWSYLLGASIIISLSAIFELIEWIAAVSLAPEQGSEYLGAQGDEWDAQADIALATVGSVISLTVSAIL